MNEAWKVHMLVLCVVIAVQLSASAASIGQVRAIVVFNGDPLAEVMHLSATRLEVCCTIVVLCVSRCVCMCMYLLLGVHACVCLRVRRESPITTAASVWSSLA